MINLSVVINEGKAPRITFKIETFDCLKTHSEAECLEAIMDTIGGLREKYALQENNFSNAK